MDVKYDVDVFVAGGGPAGCAAAISAQDKVSTHSVDIRKVQKALLDCGAYLPNFK